MWELSVVFVNGTSNTWLCDNMKQLWSRLATLHGVKSHKIKPLRA